eukprot:2424634-Rhodomonas_salina.1
MQGQKRTKQHAEMAARMSDLACLVSPCHALLRQSVHDVKIEPRMIKGAEIESTFGKVKWQHTAQACRRAVRCRAPARCLALRCSTRAALGNANLPVRDALYHAALGAIRLLWVQKRGPCGAASTKMPMSERHQVQEYEIRAVSYTHLRAHETEADL